jgi:hypothetical protein
VIAQAGIPQNGDWNLVKAKLMDIPSGLQDILLVSKDSKPVAVDWVSFE